jgi:hypothetical protein
MVVLKIEPWTSGFLGKCSSTWTISQTFFCFSCFLGRSLCFCLGLASDCDHPTYGLLSSSWNHRSVPPFLAYWLRWILLNCCLSWPYTTVFLISASQVAGTTGVSQHVWPWHFSYKHDLYRRKINTVNFLVIAGKWQ